MVKLNEMSKQKGIAAALEATRAVQEVVNSTVAESKEKLASEEGMSQRDMRKVLASIEQIGKTMCLTEKASAAALGHYTGKVQSRMEVANRRRTSRDHRTPQKDNAKRPGSLDWHNEQLEGIFGVENTNPLRLSTSRPSLAQRSDPPARRKRTVTKKKNGPVGVYKLPTPAKGELYLSAREAAAALVQSGNIKGAAVAMMNSKLVPVKSLVRLQAIATRFKKKLPIGNWGASGRKRILTTDEVKQLVEDATAGGGTIGDKEMRAALLEKLRKSRCIGSSTSVSDETAKIYMEEAKQHGRPTKHAIDKTGTRFTAERSIRSMTSFLCTIAVTSFIPSDSGEASTRLPRENELAALVSNALGNIPLTAVHKNLLTSTDDTTVFAFTGTKGKPLVPYRIANANQQTGTYSAHKLDDLNHKEGLRIRVTVTTCGGGMIAPLYCTCTGLNTREMPENTCPSGVIAIKVPGFCVGGALDPVATYGDGYGYIAFMRGSNEGAQDDSPQLINFTHYRKNVFHPFVQSIRENLHGHVPGTEVPDSLTCVSWSDGDIKQLDAIKSQDMIALDSQLKIVACKHAGATSAVEQPNDVSPMFRTLTSLTAKTTVTGAVHFALRSSIEICFKANKDKLFLKAGKEKALLDFLPVLPNMLFKSANPDAVMTGYYETGMVKRTPNGIVDTGRLGPDMAKIEATLKRPMTQEEGRAYTAALPSFIKTSFDNGHIAEEAYDEAGIPVDVNQNGEEAPRVAGISMEHCQRSKVISHEEQKRQRASLLEEAAQKVQQREAQESLKVRSILDENNAAEKKLWQVMGNEDPLPGQNIRIQLKNATLEHFEKLSVGNLKHFIHARLCDTHKPPPGVIPKTKLSRAAAEAGTLCLIKVAYDCRDRRCLKLKVPRSQAPAAGVNMTRALPLVLATASPGRRGSLSADDDGRSASALLGDQSWCARAASAVIGHFNPQPIPTDADQDRADVLTGLLCSRLSMHIERKVEESKQQHWCLEWAASNLPVMAALIVLAGHAKKDLSCANLKTSLLAVETMHFMEVTEGDLRQVEGSYLYYSTVDGLWIRSGKVVGSSTSNRCIWMRHKEHRASAMLMTSSDIESLFYTSYPSNAAANTSDILRRGYFEDLRLFVALGFLRTNAADVDMLVATSAADGILFWPAVSITRIDKTNFRGVANLKEKQLHMVGYLFELCYDLMLSPNDNVSQSPGFEACGLKTF